MAAKPTIICVDDEKIVLDSLKKILNPIFSDYSIEIAESGDEALEIIEELRDLKIDIPLIISDYVMPQMKGDELLIKVVKILPEIKTILLTGQATMDGVTNTVNNANLYRYIAKPWDQEDLVLTIKEALKIYYNEKELEEKRRELQKAYDELSELDNAKTYFLGLLSHELGTPLTGISGNAQLIKAITEDADVIESVDGILSSEKRLRKFADIAMLITRLKTKKYSLSYEEISLKNLVDLSVFNLKSYAEENGFKIKNDIDNDEYLVKCDQSLLSRVFDIVINNAIKYSNPDGELTISCDPDSSFFNISFKDNGI